MHSFYGKCRMTKEQANNLRNLIVALKDSVKETTYAQQNYRDRVYIDLILNIQNRIDKEIEDFINGIMEE